MARVHHEHGVELEPTLGAARRCDARSGSAQDFAIRGPLRMRSPTSSSRHPRCFFEQANQRLDLRIKPHHFRIELRVLGRDRRQPAEGRDYWPRC